MHKGVLALGLAMLLGIGGCSRQQSDWEKTRASNTADAYELYLKKYPDGEFTAQARAKARELYEERDWQKARDLDTGEAYQAFLKQYPEGRWSDEARIRIENFTLAAGPGTPGAPGTPTVPGTPGAPSTPAGSFTSPADTAAGAPEPPSGRPAPLPASKAPNAHGTMSAKGKYGVQLGAFKSGEHAANERWTILSRKYPALLSGLSPHVSPRKSTRGTLYRLQVADLSHERARSICSHLKSHAQSCEVLAPAH